MSRAGDKDEGGQGGSIAQFADAARRRTDRPTPRVRKRPRAKPPPPDPNVGTGLLTNLYDEKPDQLFVESADDVLDRVVSGHQDWSDQQRDWLSSLSEDELDDTVAAPPEAPEHEYDDVREQLEHHHEHRQPSRQAVPSRGSADLDPRHNQADGSRLLRQARRGGHSSNRVPRSGLAVAGVAVILVAALVVGSMTDSGSGSTHRATGRAAGVRMAAVNAPNTVAEDVARATTAIGADVEAQAKASVAAEAKAQTRARTMTKAAERARAARVRQRRAAVAHRRSDAPSISPATLTMTHASSTTTSTTPASSGTGSTSGSGPAQQSSTASQPAFGSNGSLGPGRSSDS